MNEASPPPTHWTLQGEAVAMLASPLYIRLLVHYTASPVGPYDEHALARMTLRGPQIFQMSVTSEDSMLGGRELWGFPKTLESLNWSRMKKRIRFQRKSQNFRIRTFGPQFPLQLPFFTVQNLNGQPVRVPGFIKVRAVLGFRGRQFALVLNEFIMTIQPPHPI